MRIIGGEYKSKLIKPPKNFSARPTTDFAKEGLFNILDNNFYFDQISVLDLFAGSGNISYEFASRGCRHITAVEQNSYNFKFIKKMCEPPCFDRIKPVCDDAFHFIQHCHDTYDIVFADPPFDMPTVNEIPAFVFKYEALEKQNAWLIVEHSGEVTFKDHEFFFRERKYGNVHFSFFSYSLD